MNSNLGAGARGGPAGAAAGAAGANAPAGAGAPAAGTLFTRADYQAMQAELTPFYNARASQEMYDAVSRILSNLQPHIGEFSDSDKELIKKAGEMIAARRTGFALNHLKNLLQRKVAAGGKRRTVKKSKRSRRKSRNKRRH